MKHSFFRSLNAIKKTSSLHSVYYHILYLIAAYAVCRLKQGKENVKHVLKVFFCFITHNPAETSVPSESKALSVSVDVSVRRVDCGVVCSKVLIHNIQDSIN